MQRKYLNEMYDWNKFQSLYNDGNSYNDIVRICGLGSMTPLVRGAKQGLLKVRNHIDASNLYTKTHSKQKTSIVTKNKISEAIKDKVKLGTWHYSFSKTRTFTYISKFAGVVKLHGSWELKFAKYLDDNDIKWRRPAERFYYEYDKLKGGCGYYTPDFYLIDQDLWIEIKGYEHERDRAKWKFFPYKLKILKGKNLILDYKLDIILEGRDKKEFENIRV